MSLPVTPTRRAGLKRLQDFLPNSGSKYAQNRNSDYGPGERGNVSMLSCHLRRRLILEHEVIDAVLDRYAPSTAEKFIQEIFWRGYFKGWLELRPTVWAAYRRDVAALSEEMSSNHDLSNRYNQAINGTTGIVCFDAWVQELIETGYLHNHTRMWFASIWIFTLKLPWQLGADFFYRHLIDGDPASNTLSWRWVGGLHTRGKTYLARPNNIEKYTAGRFAPYGQLATSAPPLAEDGPHPKRALPTVDTECQAGPVGLLITEEDGYTENLFKEFKPVAGIALLAARARSPHAIGVHAQASEEEALKDAVARAQDYFQCSFRSPHEPDDWAGTLVEFAKAQGLQTIVTAYAPVGPVAEKLSSARACLAEHNVMLRELRRAYDDLTWPHATRGFFGLKKKIPNILEELKRMSAPRFL